MWYLFIYILLAAFVKYISDGILLSLGLVFILNQFLYISLIFCRCPFMGQQDIVHIELFSVGTFVYTHTLKGCCNDFISTYFINHLGSHLVAFSSIPNTSTTEIIIWNLESEEHKHLAKLPSVPVGGE